MQIMNNDEGGARFTGSEYAAMAAYYKEAAQGKAFLKASLRTQFQQVQSVLPASRRKDLTNATRFLKKIRAIAEVQSEREELAAALAPSPAPVLTSSPVSAKDKDFSPPFAADMAAPPAPSTLKNKPLTWGDLSHRPAADNGVELGQIKAYIDQSMAAMREEMRTQLRAFAEEIARENSLGLQRSEAKSLLHLEKLNSTLQKMWLGDEYLPTPLFQKELASATEVAHQIAQARRLANALNEGATSLVPVVKRKPKVLVFGVLDHMAQAVQAEIPDVEIYCERSGVGTLGDYSLVILAKDFVSHSSTDALKKRYQNVHIVSGAKTRIIDAIKKHFAMN